MGPQGAVNILFARDIKASKDPEKRRAELLEEYRRKFANPLLAAQRGYIDEVIEPKTTRRKLIAALQFLKNKKVARIEKKHGNIPL
jgi:acetyl-CoA carboxylase carboxyltransferase component